MSEKTGLNGDLGGSYQFLQKLNTQLAGLWESEIMLGSQEVEHLKQGWEKIREELGILNKQIEKFKQLSDLRDKLNEPAS